MNIKELLLQKIELAETLNKSGVIFFQDEIKKILRYIEELEKK